MAILWKNIIHENNMLRDLRKIAQPLVQLVDGLVVKKIKAKRFPRSIRAHSLSRKICSFVDGQLVESTLCAIEDRGRRRFAIVMPVQDRWRFLDWATAGFMQPVLLSNARVLAQTDFLPHPQLHAWLQSSLAQQDAELAYDAPNMLLSLQS